jgi:hypothetical protein
MSKYLITIVNKKFLITLAVLFLSFVGLLYSYYWVYASAYKQGATDVINHLMNQPQNQNFHSGSQQMHFIEPGDIIG